MTPRLNIIVCKTQLLVTAFILTGMTWISGQNPFSYSELYSKEQGLPSNRVQCITEDDAGFWWIGTNAGLAQFDGAEFRVYTKDDNGLIDDRIYDLLCADDNLWIATQYGISRLDLIHGEISNYGWTRHCERVESDSLLEETAYEIHRGVDGSIWAGTHHCGFLKYVPEVDSFEIHRLDTSQMEILGSGTFATSNKIASWYTRAFVNDQMNDSIMWVGSGGGLVRFNRFTGEKECLFRFREEKGRENHIFGYYSLYQLPDGRIMLGVKDGGMMTYDPAAREYGSLTPESEDARVIFGSNPLHYYNWGDSALWITTWHGMTVMDLGSMQFTKSYFNDSDNKNYVGADFIDGDGRAVRATIWGMYVFDPIQQQFEMSSYKHLNHGYHGYTYAVEHDPVYNRYYATPRSARGMYYLDLATDEWHRVDFPKHLELNDHISLTNMSRLSDGDYLVTTTNNLVRYDPATHAITGPEVVLDLTVDKLQDVFVDSRDVAWISTREDGVIRYDTRSGELVNYRFPQQTLTVAAFDTRTFAEDSRGRIWMKRRRAYSVYFPEHDSIAHFYPEAIHISYGGTFVEDREGNMWIASYPGWLGRVSMDSVENGIVERFKIPGATKNNTISEVVKGPDGFVWCAMKDELVKLNIEDRTHESFSYNYGVDPNEFFSFQFMHDNKMVFGKRSEIVMADPHSLHANGALPKPYVTSLYLGPDPYDKDTVPSRLSFLDFKADENNFSIGFSTIGMSFGEDNTIWYRLYPLQEEWVEARNSRVANFTNVPNGDYTFQLKAANNEGIENPEWTELPVCVATPWYNTALARILFVMLGVVLLYVFYKYREEQIRKEERLRTEFEKELAEVQMSALRAQMNPHFIFNCLNSIESFIIKNDTYRASTYLNDFARLIRLILQNSRTQLISLEDEMEALGLYLEMENLRFTNKFEYEISIRPEVDLSSIEIPPMLIQPYVENAIWHGLMHKSTPGKLLIELSRENGSLKCIIEDDGVGRQRSQEMNAQKRVLKKKSVGMAITSDRISMLSKLYNTTTNVHIEDLVDSQGDPAGTRVELTINI